MKQSSLVSPLDANGIYTDHFRLSRKPFAGHDPYPCPSQEAALGILVEGLRQRRGVLTLTGEFGTGKTQLLRRLGQALGQGWELVLCYSTQLSFDELLGFVCDRLEVEVQGEGRPQRLKALKAHLRARQEQGRGVALLVDEAQHLDPEVLGHLLNLAQNGFREGRSLELVLSGAPGLEDRLARQASRHPLLEQAVIARLKPLEPAQVEDYIRQQIRQAGGDPAHLFPPAAARQVARFAQGRLRLVNALCDRALLLSQLEDQPTVTAEAVERAAGELLLDDGGQGPDEATRQRPVVAAAPPPDTEATAVMATARLSLVKPVDHEGTQPIEAVTPPADVRPVDATLDTRLTAPSTGSRPAAPALDTQQAVPSTDARPAAATVDSRPAAATVQTPRLSRRRTPRRWPWLAAGGTLVAALAAYGLWPVMVPAPDPVTPRVAEPAHRQEVQAPVVEERRQADPPRLVATPAAGPADEAIPLNIQATPGDDRDTLTIDIAGLPRGAGLSAGRQYTTDTWTLTVSELEGLKLYPAGDGRDLQLTVTATAIPPFAGISSEVSVTLPVSVLVPAADDQSTSRTAVADTPVQEDEGVQEQVVDRELLVQEPEVDDRTQATEEPQTQTWVYQAPVVQEPVVQEPVVQEPVVQEPVVQEPVVQEPVVQEPTAEEEFAVSEPSPSVVAFMASGDRLLEQGDPAGARLFFEAAARTRDPRAATAVGKTYDPVEIQRRGIRGVQGDARLASQWYLQGLEGQDPEAEQRLRDLRDWLLEHEGPDDEQLLALDRLLQP